MNNLVTILLSLRFSSIYYLRDLDLMQWQIQSPKIQLFCNETLRRSSMQNDQLLQKKIKIFLEVATNFLQDQTSTKTNFEINLTFCGRRFMRNLNLKYRDRDNPTDVLAFPMSTSWRDYEKEYPLPLGDIIICVHRARMQAAQYKIDLDREIMYLLIHGFLHLCSYDHERSKEDAKMMHDLEKTFMEKIWKQVHA